MDFWQWLVSVGAIQGDPTYYSQGRAQPDEYRHAIQVAVDYFRANPDQAASFYQRLSSAGLFQGDPAYYATGRAQPAEFTNLVNVVGQNIASAQGVVTLPADSAISGPTPPAPSDPIFQAPVQGSTTRIKAGGTLYRVADPQTGTVTYHVVYQFEGVNLGFRIGDESEFLAAFPDGAAVFQTVQKVNQAQWENAGILAVGVLDDVVDLDGMSLGATLVNSLRGYGLESLPDWIRNDRNAMTIAMTAANEGWSSGRTLRELAATSAFKSRFPAWDTMLDRAGGDELAAMNLYTNEEQAFTRALATYRGPAAQTDPQYLADLMRRGWTVDTVVPLLSAERQLRGDPAILEATNRLLSGAGLNPIGPVAQIALIAAGELPSDQAASLLASVDLTTLLEGNDPGQVFDLLNDAMTLSKLEDEGLVGLDLNFVRQLRNETGGLLDSDQVRQFAQQAAVNVLRFQPDVAKQRYGLSEEALIAVAAGRPDPEGRSSAQVLETMNRLIRERQAEAGGTDSFQAFQSAEGQLAIPAIANL